MFTLSVLIFGALINLAGSASYIRSVLHGQARPNRVTWALWAFAPFIALSAQLQSGVGWPALLTFMAGFCPLLILIASFVGRQAAWQISRFDIGCAVLAVVGLVLWRITNNATYALLFSIAADFAAGLPTLYKCWRYPQTENWHAFIAPAIAAGLTLAVTPDWHFTSIGFAAYIACYTLLMALLVRFRWGVLSVPAKTV